jgi:hypothetical protein
MEKEIFKQGLKNEEGNEKLKEDIKNEEELLGKKVDEMEEILKSVDGQEGLREKMDELGGDKIKSILDNDKVKKALNKFKKFAGLVTIPLVFGGAIFGISDLYNSGAPMGEEVNEIMMSLITVGSVATIEIKVILSSIKEKRKKEEAMKSSIPVEA